MPITPNNVQNAPLSNTPPLGTITSIQNEQARILSSQKNLEGALEKISKIIYDESTKSKEMNSVLGDLKKVIEENVQKQKDLETNLIKIANNAIEKNIQTFVMENEKKREMEKEHVQRELKEIRSAREKEIEALYNHLSLANEERSYSKRYGNLSSEDTAKTGYLFNRRGLRKTLSEMEEAEVKRHSEQDMKRMEEVVTSEVHKFFYEKGGMNLKNLKGVLTRGLNAEVDREYHFHNTLSTSFLVDKIEERHERQKLIDREEQIKTNIRSNKKDREFLLEKNQNLVERRATLISNLDSLKSRLEEIEETTAKEDDFQKQYVTLKEKYKNSENLAEKGEIFQKLRELRDSINEISTLKDEAKLLSSGVDALSDEIDRNKKNEAENSEKIENIEKENREQGEDLKRVKELQKKQEKEQKSLSKKLGKLRRMFLRSELGVVALTSGVAKILSSIINYLFGEKSAEDWAEEQRVKGDAHLDYILTGDKKAAKIARMNEFYYNAKKEGVLEKEKDAFRDPNASTFDKISQEVRVHGVNAVGKIARDIFRGGKAGRPLSSLEISLMDLMETDDLSVINEVSRKHIGVDSSQIDIQGQDKIDYLFEMVRKEKLEDYEKSKMQETNDNTQPLPQLSNNSVSEGDPTPKVIPSRKTNSADINDALRTL